MWRTPDRLSLSARLIGPPSRASKERSGRSMNLIYDAVDISVGHRREERDGQAPRVEVLCARAETRSIPHVLVERVPIDRDEMHLHPDPTRRQCFEECAPPARVQQPEHVKVPGG